LQNDPFCSECKNPLPYSIRVSGASHRPNSRQNAYIDNDGKIWLPVRAEGTGGLVGDAFEPLPVDHPDYEKLRVFLEAASDGDA